MTNVLGEKTTGRRCCPQPMTHLDEDQDDAACHHHHRHHHHHHHHHHRHHHHCQEGHVAPPGGDRWSCAPDPCQIITQVMPHTDTHKCYTATLECYIGRHTTEKDRTSTHFLPGLTLTHHWKPSLWKKVLYAGQSAQNKHHTRYCGAETTLFSIKCNVCMKIVVWSYATGGG